MTKNEKKILVTGGAGFIGSHLVKKLVNQGYFVTVIDDLSRGTLDSLNAVKGKFKFIQKDLRSELDLVGIFEGHDVVFNLAALNTGVDYDLGRTEKMFEDNMLLQMIPIRVAAQTKTIKKFIQISSASVYSRKAMETQVPTPETADSTTPEPSKLGYALAKKMGEHLAWWYSQNTRLKTVIVRFINVYGEADNFDSKGHFIPVMIRKFFDAKKTVEVFGSGNQKRSFLYVEDAVNALLLLEKKGKNGEVYNVDAGEERSVREVVERIAQLFHEKKLRISFNTKKPEGSQRRFLDSSKLRNLGWKPKVSFELGLERTYTDIISRLSQIE